MEHTGTVLELLFWLGLLDFNWNVEGSSLTDYLSGLVTPAAHVWLHTCDVSKLLADIRCSYHVASFHHLEIGGWPKNGKQFWLLHSMHELMFSWLLAAVSKGTWLTICFSKLICIPKMFFFLRGLLPESTMVMWRNHPRTCVGISAPPSWLIECKRAASIRHQSWPADDSLGTRRALPSIFQA